MNYFKIEEKNDFVDINLFIFDFLRINNFKHFEDYFLIKTKEMNCGICNSKNNCKKISFITFKNKLQQGENIQSFISDYLENLKLCSNCVQKMDKNEYTLPTYIFLKNISQENIGFYIMKEITLNGFFFNFFF
jgi:hypothetical protein